MTTKFDLSNELILKRYKQGFKLIRSDFSHQKNNPSQNINTILNIPSCAYLLNTASEIEAINSNGIIACGYHSAKEAHGKSIAEVATKETAQRVIKVHQESMRSQTIKITEEEILRKNDSLFQCLTIVSPWYSLENQILGVIGFSIVTGYHSVVNSLSEIMNLGLEYPAINNIEQKQTISSSLTTNIYFSKRESECLYFFVRGKTLKEIAKIIGLSYRTVEHYFENIKNKVGVNSKSELMDKVFDQFK